VFWVKNRLKNKFLGEKNLSHDFFATIMAEIWENWTTRCLSQQTTSPLIKKKKQFEVDNMSSAPLARK